MSSSCAGFRRPCHTQCEWPRPSSCSGSPAGWSPPSLRRSHRRSLQSSPAVTMWCALCRLMSMSRTGMACADSTSAVRASERASQTASELPAHVTSVAGSAALQAPPQKACSASAGAVPPGAALPLPRSHRRSAPSSMLTTWLPSVGCQSALRTTPSSPGKPHSSVRALPSVSICHSDIPYAPPELWTVRNLSAAAAAGAMAHTSAEWPSTAAHLTLSSSLSYSSRCTSFSSRSAAVPTSQRDAPEPPSGSAASARAWNLTP
mmetsp:Transcript_43733/g.111787  ORF Transcript_43733/g.111787 Transcript_43733/m.111787 type:complete len:262 (+) Transcript_43733:296-1081(+)